MSSENGGAFTYDLESVYDNQISPLIHEIITICRRVNMPMLTVFQYASDSPTDGASLCTSAYIPIPRTTAQLVAAKDIVMNGFATEALPEGAHIVGEPFNVQEMQEGYAKCVNALYALLSYDPILAHLTHKNEPLLEQLFNALPDPVKQQVVEDAITKLVDKFAGEEETPAQENLS